MGSKRLPGPKLWMEREDTALRIKTSMARDTPLGLGTTELLTLGPAARPYVDLYPATLCVTHVTVSSL
eukprot:COSAG05_NODE_2186_length_3428_cov_2.071493_1_plen_68_part_00